MLAYIEIPCIFGTYDVGNNIALPIAGPVDEGLRSGYNNFYGYRVPANGTLLGFTLDFAAATNDGVYHVFYWLPNPSANDVNNFGRCSFAKGGPIISPAHPGGNDTQISPTPNPNGSGEQRYATGATLFKEGEELKIEEGGFIFAVSDLSYRRSLVDDQNTQIGGDLFDPVWLQSGWSQTAQGRDFEGPRGNTHMTVYIRFDE